MRGVRIRVSRAVQGAGAVPLPRPARPDQASPRHRSHTRHRNSLRGVSIYICEPCSLFFFFGLGDLTLFKSGTFKYVILHLVKKFNFYKSFEHFFLVNTGTYCNVWSNRLDLDPG